MPVNHHRSAVAHQEDVYARLVNLRGGRALHMRLRGNAEKRGERCGTVLRWQHGGQTGGWCWETGGRRRARTWTAEG